MIEGHKVTKLPTAATPAERASMKDQMRALESGAATELYPPLDRAKVIWIRREIQNLRESDPTSVLFNADRAKDAEEKIGPMSYGQANKEISTATLDMVLLEPVYYEMLADLAEQQIETQGMN